MMCLRELEKEVVYEKALKGYLGSQQFKWVGISKVNKENRSREVKRY